MKEASYPVTGMTCASCALNVQNKALSLPGVDSAEVNYASQTLRIRFDEAQLCPEAIRTAVEAIGYDLIIPSDGSETGRLQEEARAALLRKQLHNLLFAGLFTIPVFIYGMFGMHWPHASWVMWAFSTPVLLVWGNGFFIRAFRQFGQGHAGMDTLVALSTGIAYVLSVFNTLFPQFWLDIGIHPHVYFEASAMVVVFVMAGKYLEERARAGTTSAVAGLISLQPGKAIRVKDKITEEVPVGEIQPGDQVLVRTGDRVPVDGVVVSGEFWADESLLTGESLPMHRVAGAEVYSGSLVSQGNATLKVQRSGQETILSRMAEAVRQAQDSRAPVQRLADRIAGIFVPVVVSLALLTLITWGIWGGKEGWVNGILHMVTVLVIACPCALGLATPTAIMVGIGKAAGSGILIRDAGMLEAARKTNIVVLDKTGTLTTGKPVVTGFVHDLFPIELQNYLAIILFMEQRSSHPLASSIVKWIGKSGVVPAEALLVNEVSGKGITCTHEGHLFRIGSLPWIQELLMEWPQVVLRQVEKWRVEGVSISVVSVDNKVVAAFAIQDTLREGSRSAVDRLHEMGIRVVMMTGDQEAVARTISSEAGINEYQSGMLPADKAAAIRRLQASGLHVAMIGDGVNDSEALATADVSISLATGTDIAMNAAGITIMRPDLRLVPKALEISRRTVAAIRQNLFWAFFYNVLGIPVAAGALEPIFGFSLDPMLSGAAMALSSLSVVLNSLRIKFAQT